MEEIWMPVVRNVNYEVSSLGRIRRVSRARGARAGRILKQNSNGSYLQVNLFMENVSTRVLVHLLVAEAFIGPCPDGKEVNHRDTDKRNNEETNLEYCTHIENMEHASVNGLVCFGERNKSTKVDMERVQWIRREVASGRSRRSVAREVGLSFQHVGDIVSGKKRRG